MGGDLHVWKKKVEEGSGKKGKIWTWGGGKLGGLKQNTKVDDNYHQELIKKRHP